MSLIKEIKGGSAVILAQSFNTSIFNHYWLINKGIIGIDKIQPNSLIVPGMSQIFTPDFSLQVTQEQLQFAAINNDFEKFEHFLNNSLTKIVETLPEIPYRALGINFTCLISDTEKSISDLSRELFYTPQLKINSFFEDSNSRFGTYLSTNFLDSRLKLDIKPVTLNDANPQLKKEFIQFAFNFHIDINGNYEMLLKNLRNWNLYYKEMNLIVNSL